MDAEAIGRLLSDLASHPFPQAGEGARVRGSVAATQRLLTLGPAAWDRAHRGHLTASSVVLDPGGRVLLCWHPKYGRWLQLGGHVEATDLSVRDAAWREAREESGLSDLEILGGPAAPDGLVDIDVHPVACPALGGAHYDLRFAWVAHAPRAVTASPESLVVRWHADVPDDADESLRRSVAKARALLGRGRAVPSP